MQPGTKALAKARRSMADDKEQELYKIYDELMADSTLPFGKVLPPAVITMKRMRSSSRIRFQICSQGYVKIAVNQRLYHLNSTKKIHQAFKHIIIHIYQQQRGHSAAHTRAFQGIAKRIDAIDTDELKTPAPKGQRFTYVCPSGCQELRTTDSVVLVCGHCSSKMRALGQAGYKKYKAKQRADAKQVLERLQGGKEA